jgi:hypothetical protein
MADQAAARQMAVDSVRSMVAEDARRGVIDLNGRIDIQDKAGNVLMSLHFLEAFALDVPGRLAP